MSRARMADSSDATLCKCSTARVSSEISELSDKTLLNRSVVTTLVKGECACKRLSATEPEAACCNCWTLRARLETGCGDMNFGREAVMVGSGDRKYDSTRVASESTAWKWKSTRKRN